MRSHLFQVMPGGEGLTGASDDDSPYGARAANLGDGRMQRGDQIFRQRIPTLGPVEGQQCHWTAVLAQQRTRGEIPLRFDVSDPILLHGLRVSSFGRIESSKLLPKILYFRNRCETWISRQGLYIARQI